MTSDAQRFPLSRAEYAGILGFWSVVATVAVATRRLDPRIPDLPPAISNALTQLTILEYAIWLALTPAVIWFAGRIGLDHGRRIERLVLLISAGVLVGIAADALLALARSGMLPSPRGGRRPRHGGLAFLDDMMVYFAVALFGIARSYYLRYQARHDEAVKLAAESAKLQAELAEARLEALRTQLNPHFLFNTLNAISALVTRDPPGVRRMIARLSDLLRSTLAQQQAEVPLHQELDLLQRYVDIMQIRFEGKLDVTIDVDPAAREALVPNLMLQPLVENAIKHGVDASDGRGRIQLTARASDDRLVIAIRDSGTGASTREAEGAGIGLRNTRSRLEHLYGASQQLTLRTENGQGTVAEIVLPLRRAGAERRG